MVRPLLSVRFWPFSACGRSRPDTNSPFRLLSYSAPADERHVLSLPQSNLAAPKIARGRHAHVTPSHLCLSRMLLENDRLALL